MCQRVSYYMSMNSAHGPSYKVVIIGGASIAATTFANTLSTVVSTSRSAPLRIALFKRSVVDPDIIVSGFSSHAVLPCCVRSVSALALMACMATVLDTGETCTPHISAVHRAAHSIMTASFGTSTLTPGLRLVSTSSEQP